MLHCYIKGDIPVGSLESIQFDMPITWHFRLNFLEMMEIWTFPCFILWNRFEKLFNGEKYCFHQSQLVLNVVGPILPKVHKYLDEISSNHNLTMFENTNISHDIIRFSSIPYNYPIQLGIPRYNEYSLSSYDQKYRLHCILNFIDCIILSYINIRYSFEMDGNLGITFDMFVFTNVVKLWLLDISSWYSWNPPILVLYNSKPLVIDENNILSR